MFIALGFVLLQLAAASLTNGHSWQETDRGFGQPRQVGRSRTAINSGLRMNVQNGVQQRPARRTKSPARIEQLQPLLRADAKRVRLYFGPYSIPGRHVKHTPDPDQTDPDALAINTYITGFCTECTALYAKADTHFLNGSRAGLSSGLYTHHITVLDWGKQNLPWYLCDAKTGYGAQKEVGFMISGVDEAPNYFTAPDGVMKSGYFIGKEQTSFFMAAELINYRDTNTTAYITAEVEYIEGMTDEYSDTSVSLLSVTGCKKPEYFPPHGEARYNATSPTFSMPIDGYIIHAKGHLHDGGINVLLMLDGQVICDSRAIYGGKGSEGVGPDGKPWETIREMTQCSKPVAIKAGDLVSVMSIYDTTLHPLRQAADGHGGDREEMGVFFINFTPSLAI